MASAPKVSRKPKPHSNGKSETKTVTATPAKEREARGPRKPAVERAYNLIATLEKKITAITKNVGRWIVPEDATLAEHVLGLQTGIAGVKAATATVVDHIGALYDVGFEVKAAGRGGRTPLAVGAVVVLRTNRYEPEAHGANDYRVRAEKGRLFEIESRVDPELRHFVPRAWIMHAPSGTAGVDD